jgi:hypothetical protein
MTAGDLYTGLAAAGVALVLPLLLLLAAFLARTRRQGEQAALAALVLRALGPTLAAPPLACGVTALIGSYLCSLCIEERYLHGFRVAAVLLAPVGAQVALLNSLRANPSAGFGHHLEECTLGSLAAQVPLVLVAVLWAVAVALFG